MITIASYDDGNIEEYASFTRENKIEYAKYNGYEILLNNADFKPQGYSPEWEQLNFICWALNNKVKDKDWLFYTGADSFFLDFGYKTERIIENNPGADLILSKDQFAMNNNGMLIRNCKWTRNFYFLSWEMRGPVDSPRRFKFPINGYIHQWAEQGAMIRLIDFLDSNDPNGHNPHIAYERQEIINGYEPEFYGSFYKKPEFVIHFPDMHPKNLKIQRMQDALQHVKKHQ